ncbi:hypothetical protein ACHQM5_021365 [Ranunculus cassubicifolius]
MVFMRRRGALLPCLDVLRRSPKCPWLLSSSFAYSDETPQKKSKAAPLQETKMVDRFKMRARGGDGGSGCSSFHRSRHDRRGKPDGGNGGRGGDVILECSHAVWDFRGLQHHVKGKRGGNGLSKNKIGSKGGDKILQVPVGTLIHLVEGEVAYVVEERPLKELDPWDLPDTLETTDHSDSNPKTLPRNVNKPTSVHNTGQRSFYSTFNFVVGETEPENIEHEEEEEEEDEDEEEDEEEVIQYNVAELTEPGKRVRIARGGEGGLGNVSQGKLSDANKKLKDDTATNPEPLEDEDQASLSAGIPGYESVLILELKSIADVGLVGMPNAGKSTLLGAISRAKPMVGHYAFTTLRPNIGKLNYDDFFSVKVADIPGLIKGAHENRGLGHAFLRHIERTKVLAYVVDLAAVLDGRKGIPPWEQLRDLVMELECHQEGLSDRPSLIVANKIDEEGAEEVYEELKKRVTGVPIFPCCAVLEEGVPELKTGLRQLVDGGECQRLELENINLD